MKNDDYKYRKKVATKCLNSKYE